MSDASELMERAEIRSALYDHARTWFPKECCGLIVEGPQGARAVLADNLQDRYHALDSEMYPRTAEQAYLLDPRLLAQAESDGERIVAIVHSHCRVGAYFSDKDQEDARSPFDDGPLYPGVDYVVVDAQDETIAGHKVFRWSDPDARYVER
jgi:proteasome lid subunit RPN8/RPN11